MSGTQVIPTAQGWVEVPIPGTLGYAVDPAASRAGLLLSTAWKTENPSVAAANTTLSLALALDCEWDSVRLVWQNDQVTGTTLDAVAIAPSASINNGYDPVDAAGGAVAFTPVTFNNAGANGLPPSPSGSAFTLTTPTTPSTLAPVLCFSDWMRVPSISRSDESDGRPILMCRVFSTAGGQANPQIPRTLTEQVMGGRLVRSYNKAGGNYTTAGFTSPLQGATIYCSPIGVQCIARRRGVTVLGIGDSLTQGMLTSNNDTSPWMNFATAALSTRDMPMSFVNGGWAGAIGSTFLTYGKRLIDGFMPNVVVFSAFTPNDPAMQAASNATFSWIMELAHYVVTLGGVPILATAVPFGLPAGQEAIRQTINNRVRSLAAAGTILMIDLDAAVRDPLAPSTVPAIYRASGGNHLSVLGYQVCGQAATQTLVRAAAGFGLR